MVEEEIIRKLENEGYKNVFTYEAPPGEVDEEHEHDFDTRLVILKGEIKITSVVDGVTTNMSYKLGSEVNIPKNTTHAAKVGSEGCRYIVGEKH